MTTAAVKFLLPPGWSPPRGYANGVMAQGQTVYLGGLIGWNSQQQFETDDFVEQVEQTLKNIVAVLQEAGARPEHLVRMTWFILDREEYLNRQSELGKVYRKILGKHFPAMSMLEVSGLMEKRAKVEIEATAVIPHTG